MELFFGLIVAGIVAAWVYQDASKRGMESGSALVWGLANLFLLILFLPLYLLNRPALPGDSRPVPMAGGFRVCPKCNLANPADCNFCKDCGAGLRVAG